MRSRESSENQDEVEIKLDNDAKIRNEIRHELQEAFDQRFNEAVLGRMKEMSYWIK